MTEMLNRLFLLLIGITFLSCGCSLQPEYRRPEAPVSEKWPEGPAYPKLSPEAPGEPAPAAETGWRDFFVDERMRQVIETALANNRDLRLAALNAERARALYGIQRAELLPPVSAAGFGSRQQVPGDISGVGTDMIAEQYSVDLGITSWEIDFFGRIRSLKDRALEEYLATDQARRSTRISLISAVAETYLTYAADRERLKLAEATLAAQEATYGLIKKRAEMGLSSELDLSRAATQVEIARGDIARYTRQTAQGRNVIHYLLGTDQHVPGELLPNGLTGVAPPMRLSPGLSSGVLLQRPDILAREHRLKAANANIGAARAAFFPRISLTSTLGTASRELAALFDAGQGTWTFAPRIVLPIFDARLWSAHKATKVEREITLAEYEKSIQNAFREVADALAVRGTVDRQLAAQESLVRAVEKTYRMANVLYIKGIDSYLGVLDAQRELYAAQQGLITIRLAKLANEVRLYAVLGGGGDEAPRNELEALAPP